MEHKGNYNVKKTVDVFNITVDDKMLPEGVENPLKHSQKGLAPADLVKIVLGPVETQSFKTEEGNIAMMEKMNRHIPWSVRHPDPESDESSDDAASMISVSTNATSASNLEGIARTWDDIMLAKNKGKYKARNLRIIRKELDNLVKQSEGNESFASSGNSTRKG